MLGPEGWEAQAADDAAADAKPQQAAAAPQAAPAGEAGVATGAGGGDHGGEEQGQGGAPDPALASARALWPASDGKTLRVFLCNISRWGTWTPGRLRARPAGFALCMPPAQGWSWGPLKLAACMQPGMCPPSWSDAALAEAQLPASPPAPGSGGCAGRDGPLSVGSATGRPCAHVPPLQAARGAAHAGGAPHLGVLAGRESLVPRQAPPVPCACKQPKLREKQRRT